MDSPYRRPRPGLPVLPSIRVASPCSVSWHDLDGDRVTRLCATCDRQVHDLSAMTTEELAAFLERTAATKTCVRFFRRADGTVLTQDCPVGVTRKRRRQVAVACGVSGALALAVSMTPRLAPEPTTQPPERDVVVAPTRPDEEYVPVMGELEEIAPSPPRRRHRQTHND